VLSEAYAEEPFVVVSHRPPSTKACLGSNAAHLTARFDERTGSVLVLSAIDNLGKGASGAAVQNMNLVLGISETTGLSVTGVYP
jgi:N-acetyl-gamma-glutamyl-phosphate reductase